MKTLFIDMDNVLVDFQSGIDDSKKNGAGDFCSELLPFGVNRDGGINKFKDWDSVLEYLLP